MAGQTPEPSFLPAGQDSGLTQGRPAWQVPPAYTPPGGAGAGNGAGAGVGQAWAAPAPSYNPQEQGYPPQDQTYIVGGQNAAGQDYQGYQGYQQGYQGYGEQGGPTPPPQWQAPGAAQVKGRTKPKGEKGLVGSLFDFSFASMVTPKIIKALYVLFTIWTIFAAIGILFFFYDFGKTSALVFALIIVDPIFILLSLGVYRIILEAFMVIFQIHGELKGIREQGEKQA